MRSLEKSLYSHLRDTRTGQALLRAATVAGGGRELRARRQMAALEDPGRRPIAPQYLMACVDRAATDDAVLTCDSGTVATWAARHWTIRGGRDFYLSGNLATMAPGLPYAIAIQHAFPGRQVIAFIGDGGFAMTMNALLTAAQQRIPVVTVVLNNGVLGWVKDGQRRRGNRFIASELGRNDYARIAQAMGCVGVRVETLADLAGELDRVRNAKDPIVLDVITTEDAPFWQVQSSLAKEGPGGE